VPFVEHLLRGRPPARRAARTPIPPCSHRGAAGAPFAALTAGLCGPLCIDPCTPSRWAGRSCRSRPLRLLSIHASACRPTAAHNGVQPGTVQATRLSSSKYCATLLRLRVINTRFPSATNARDCSTRHLPYRTSSLCHASNKWRASCVAMTTRWDGCARCPSSWRPRITRGNTGTGTVLWLVLDSPRWPQPCVPRPPFATSNRQQLLLFLDQRILLLTKTPRCDRPNPLCCH
jgi:hypothetical protein